MKEQKAKYEEIIEWLMKRLESGDIKPGAKVESEHQLAELFLVSRQTVRHAISVLEGEGIIERRRGSGTYISTTVDVGEKEEKSMRVAVITTYVQEYIFSAMLKEIEHRLATAGYDMQVAFTNNTVEKERLVLKNILEKNMVDGIIIETTKSALPNPNLELYRKIMKRGIPILFINSYYKELDIPHVSLNDRLAGKMVTEHLLKCGHRKIAAIFKADDGQGHLRYSGYMEALMKEEIELKSKRIVWLDTDAIRNMREDGAWILRRIKDCTACVCYNDEVANHLVALCLEQGIKVPEDLSVIGIDDSELATFCEVPLTSAKNPIRDVAKVAALELLEMMKGLPIPKAAELDPEIVNRNSVRIINTL